MTQLFTRALQLRMQAALDAKSIRYDWLPRVNSQYAEWTGDWVLDHRRLWSNAEEFLDLLESAADPQTSTAPLRAMVLLGQQKPEVIAELARDARAYLAAACHHFMPEPDADLRLIERWRPYRRWGNEVVGKEDTIISFNYDTVVERARGLDQLFVPKPWEPRQQVEQAELLKLHGSVTWIYDETAKEHRTLDDPYEGVRSGASFILGIPGPSKMHLSRDETARLWDAAEKALEMADVIVLVGYRFAETDDEAKRRLLGAIARNAVVGMTIRVVLGPHVGGDDARRVAGMLDWALRARGAVSPSEANRRQHKFSPGPQPGPAVLDIVPMWAQDFLSVVVRDHLNHWPDSGQQPPSQSA